MSTLLVSALVIAIFMNTKSKSKEPRRSRAPFGSDMTGLLAYDWGIKKMIIKHTPDYQTVKLLVT